MSTKTAILIFTVSCSVIFLLKNVVHAFIFCIWSNVETIRKNHYIFLLSSRQQRGSSVPVEKCHQPHRLRSLANLRNFLVLIILESYRSEGSTHGLKTCWATVIKIKFPGEWSCLQSKTPPCLSCLFSLFLPALSYRLMDQSPLQPWSHPLNIWASWGYFLYGFPFHT